MTPAAATLKYMEATNLVRFVDGRGLEQTLRPDMIFFTAFNPNAQRLQVTSAFGATVNLEGDQAIAFAQAMRDSSALISLPKAFAPPSGLIL